MNTKRLYEILRETTTQLRKGDQVTEHKVGNVNVVDIYNMPHVSEAKGLEQVDVFFMIIGVDKEKAEKHKAEFISIMKTYPQPNRLAGGPSYIEVGAEIGDQGAAFQLFALGKVLGLWDVITPTKLGIKGPEADEMAGRGLVMITGFREAA